MSDREIKLNGALAVAGMVATVVVVLGLKMLGATDRLMAFGYLVVLIAISLLGWLVHDDSPSDRR